MRISIPKSLTNVDLPAANLAVSNEEFLAAILATCSSLTAMANIKARSGFSLRLWSVSLLGGFSVACAHYEPRPIRLGETAVQLQSRSLSDESLREFVSAGLSREFVVWPPSAWTFDELNWVAFYYNPTLETARAQWATARAGKTTAAARPNPTVGLTPGYNFNAASGVSPWFPGLSVDWPIETAGKAGKRRQRAHYVAENARLNANSALWEIRSALRAALIDAVAVDRRLQLLRQQMQVQEKIINLLEQRVAAGRSTASELTGARVLVHRLQADSADAQRTREEARGRLAEALGVTRSAVQTLSVQYPLEAQTSLPFDFAEARTAALQQRADLLAALANYEASQAGLQIEIARQYPDVHLGTGYQWDQGENKWNLALTLELPVLHHNQGPIAEAKARRQEAATQLVALQLRVITEIDRARVAWQTSVEQWATVRRLNATMRDRVDMTSARMAVGAADQLEMQLATSELGGGELLELEAEIRLAKDAGHLEDTLQIPFAAVERGAEGPTVKEKAN